jgi:hypothetical protein
MLSPLAIVSARSELLGLAKANCWISPQQKSCKFASAAVGKEGQKLKNVPGAMPRQAGGSQWIAESANHEANAAIKLIAFAASSEVIRERCGCGIDGERCRMKLYFCLGCKGDENKTRLVGAFPSQLWEFLTVGGRFR